MAWIISQTYEIELNSSLYSCLGEPDYTTPGTEKQSLRISASSFRSSMSGFTILKRTLFISDHRNNQLNSRLNKKADQENWDTTHQIILLNRNQTRSTRIEA